MLLRRRDTLRRGHGRDAARKSDKRTALSSQCVCNLANPERRRDQINYYDATLDSAFLSQTLLPYLNGVADFYTSYAVRNASSGRMDLPFTCAQEICSPSGSLHNAHQDLA